MTEGARDAWVVGSRAEAADIVLNYPQVSGRHLALKRRDEAWWIEDLGSTNGTRLGTRPLAPGQPERLEAGQTVWLGRTLSVGVTDDLLERLAAGALEPVQSWWTEALRQPQETRRPSLPTQAVEPATREAEPDFGAVSLSLGHAEGCDIVIASPSVARWHARLWYDGEALTLEDLGSPEGTVVLGERIARTPVAVGTEISLGAHRMTIEAAWLERLQARHRLVGASANDTQATTVVVGRDASADVVLDVPVVSSRHLELVSRGDGLWRLRDLESTNGTSIHHPEHRIREAIVSEDDTIYLGSYRQQVRDLLARAKERHGATGGFDAARSGAGEVWTVGRDPSCTITLDDPSISREHLRVRKTTGGRLELEDPGSINGTFVDGERLRGRRVVDAGARVQVGRYSLRVDPEHGLVVRDFRGDLSLQADRITVEVQDRSSAQGAKRILHDVSFTAYPTEFVGLMGPSGAGKTTLLTALNGYQPPTRGRSLVNGQDLVEHYDLFRSRIGYVPQDDIVYPQLTVYESLYYTARLRLPPDTTEEEIETRIQRILERLEIQQTRDTRIGDATRRGISGGQRKRVNLAQELLTEPSLLLLDEPTSGLAAEDTINVMRLLRSLADQGKTVLLTIHQPSLEAYRLMDNVLFLLQGRLVYYGPAWPESILFFHPEADAGSERDALLADPGSALRPLAIDQREALETPGDQERDKALRDVVQKRRQDYIDSDHYRRFVWERATASPDAAPGQDGAATRQATAKASIMGQLGVLTRRAARIKVKDTLSVAILLAQAPIIALILALVFSGGGDAYGFFEHLSRGPAALFLLVASAVWFGCSNSAREIVGESAIYRRERMVNLRISAYVGSKFLVLGALCALQCFLLLGIVYFPLGLQAPFLSLYALLLLTSLAGLGMGLTLSAFVSSGESAVGLVPLLLIPQIILGGVIMPVHELPTAMKTLSMTMVARWGFEGALHLEYRDTDADAVRAQCGIPACIWGIGPTGQGYWPSDPARTREAVEQSGMRAVEGRVVLPVEPATDHELCRAYCASLQKSWPVTPLERSFGIHRDDPARTLARTQIVEEGRSPAAWRAPASSSRTSPGWIWSILLGFNVFLFGLVCAAMKARDVDVGGG